MTKNILQYLLSNCIRVKNAINEVRMQINGIGNYQQNKQRNMQQKPSFSAIQFSVERCKPAAKEIMDYFEKKGMLVTGLSKEGKKIHIITTKYNSVEEKSTVAELISDVRDLETIPGLGAKRFIDRFNKNSGN